MGKFFGLDFSDVRTNPRLDHINLGVAFVLAFVLLGVGNTFTAAQWPATIFLFMILSWATFTAFELIGGKGDKITEIIGTGTWNNLKNSLVIGAALAVFIRLASPASVVPLTFSVQDPSVNYWLYFFVTRIIAPFAEANFFRGFIMPHVRGHLVKDFRIADPLAGLLALGIQAVAFGGYHWLILGGDPTKLTAVVIFGLIAGIGVQYFRSIGFEYGLHFTNNLLAP